VHVASDIVSARREGGDPVSHGGDAVDQPALNRALVVRGSVSMATLRRTPASRLSMVMVNRRPARPAGGVEPQVAGRILQAQLCDIAVAC
jgi:hypothetical protein